MSVVLHTFDGGTVNAIDDARFYSYLTGGQSGVAEGVRITSAGGLTLHITGGWGVILGRLFTVQAQDIEVTPSVSGTQKGRLILQIDMSDSDRPARIISQAAQSLPQLVQEDINGDGLIYQLPLAEYSVTEVALSDLKNTTPVLQSIAISTYTHSDNVLSGSGANGKFKATSGGRYTAFTIDGQSYSVQSGGENEVELTAGVWYTFVLDVRDKTVNFNGGGGLSDSKLALATAEEYDVRAGKTYYAGDKELKTGTLKSNYDSGRYYLIKDGVLGDQVYSGNWVQESGYVRAAFPSATSYVELGTYVDLTVYTKLTINVSSVSADGVERGRTMYIRTPDGDNVASGGYSGGNVPATVEIGISSLTGFHSLHWRSRYSQIRMTDMYLS